MVEREAVKSTSGLSKGFRQALTALTFLGSIFIAIALIWGFLVGDESLEGAVVGICLILAMTMIYIYTVDIW